MIRKCSLMFSLIALTTFLSVQNPHAKPVGNRFTTSVTLGPAVFPMPGIRFQYRFNDHLSLNSGLSYIVAAGDFNAGINFHLPVNSIDPYLGARRIFIYHLTGSIDLSAGVAGIETENYFVEAGSRSWIWSGKNRFWQYKNRVGNHSVRLVFLIDSLTI